MAATTYTGNGGTQTITNGGNNTIGTTFQPDFVWIKDRSSASWIHCLYDSVRGIGKTLNSTNTAAESGNSGDLLGSFNSNGFSVNTTYLGGTNVSTNANGDAFIGWQWKAGGTGVTNTNGSITSTVSANPTAGFSVVTYSGNGTAGATVGHGLGVTPAMVIYKARGLPTGFPSGGSWLVWHQSISQSSFQTSSTIQLNGFTGCTLLNGTNASLTYGFDGQINGSGTTYVAYCFAAISGYSAMGSFTGNGSSDGPFIFTGFRPRWILFKRTDVAQDWMILDSSRDTYNVAGSALWPDLSNSENQSSVPANSSNTDFLSNGFKIRNPASGSGYNNTSGGTYIYAAFAENPFKYSRAR